MQFTPEQRAALDLHVHCAVHANAGSGKTSVVTHRFVKILVETGAPLDQIIAITFTRAAAAEMRERIHRLLNEAQHSPELRASFGSPLSDAELCRQLRQWATTISTARISTFHSFCAGLVRQYSEELALDADIREIEGTEASTLVEDSVRRALTEHLAAGSSTADRLASVFDDVSISVVSELLIRATSDTSFATALATNAHPDARAKRRTYISKQMHAIARDTLQLVTDALVPLGDIPSIAQVLEHARALAARCHNADDSAVIAEIAKLYESTFTKEHELRSAMIPKELRSTIDRKPVVPSEVAHNLRVMTTPWDDIEEMRFDEITSILYDVAQTSREYYRNAKRERNAIDFDDMIHLTLELLNDGSITNTLRKSVRYIMVDEFQDTDPLQYEVLSRIAPALRGEDAPSPNVYIVGDDKQSIYGFRDADVRLFRRATYALQCANHHRGDDTGYRPLVTSFRMHERVAHSVNAICSAMFGAVATPPITDTTSYDVGYQPLRSISAGIVSDHVGTCVVVPTTDDEIVAIADVVGNILSGTLRREITEFDRTAGTWSTRPPQPSDIAVLVQNNAHVVALGEALSRLKIPTDLHGGASFFARPEVMDIRALLTVCISPSDNLAVAGLCRSPLLRCTDAEIATAALLGRRSSLRDGIAQCVADNSASENLLRAHTLLSSWEAASVRMSPVELIQLALDTSEWYATLAHEDRREQILANVDKVFEIVRSAVDGTGGTLYDAVVALNPVNGDRERDGFVPSDGNAVRVMTIHASKGLEFGIVVLGGLASAGRSETFLSTEPLGVTFTLAAGAIDPEFPSGITKRPLLQSHLLAKQINEQRERAEYRRRLYVALTRAKSHLVLMHTSDEIPGELGGMAGVLGAALDTARAHVAITTHTTAEPYQATTRERNELHLLDTLPASLPDIVAPTHFLQTHHWDTADDHVGDGDESSGAAYGIAVHDVLALVLPNACDVDHIERLRVIARALAMHQLDRERAAEAALEISALFDSELIATHRDELRASRREVRLVGALDDAVIQGIIDCRLAHADGSISVWDWKTNSVRDEADLDALAQFYHRQMQTYAWLCFTAYPDCSAVTTRLVFTKAIIKGIDSYERSITWQRSQLDDITEDLRSALAELLARSNS